MAIIGNYGNDLVYFGNLSNSSNLSDLSNSEDLKTIY